MADSLMSRWHARAAKYADCVGTDRHRAGDGAALRHRTNAPSVATTDQIRQLADDGWLVVRGAFDVELIDRLIEETHSLVPTPDHGVVRGACAGSSFVCGVAAHPLLGGLLRDLLGPEVWAVADLLVDLAHGPAVEATPAIPAAIDLGPSIDLLCGIPLTPWPDDDAGVRLGSAAVALSPGDLAILTPTTPVCAGARHGEHPRRAIVVAFSRHPGDGPFDVRVVEHGRLVGPR